MCGPLMDVFDGLEEVIESVFPLFLMGLCTIAYILFLSADSIEFFDTRAPESLSLHHFSASLAEI